ncbi:MAG: NTPase [Euryarchaeota archaeon]|nr:NTPase [Euryarchaeota archaeon]
MYVKIGLSGLPGVGKTTTLIKTIQMLEEEGYKVGGMITEEVKEGNRRVGFYVRDWANDRKEIFAHVNFESKYKVGRYGIKVEVLDEVGVRALEEAMDTADIIVIDEIGKMEVVSKKFVSVVREIVDMDKHMILTLHKKSRNPLLQEIRRRDDIRMLEVTPINRNLLPFRIVTLIKGEQ